MEDNLIISSFLFEQLFKLRLNHDSERKNVAILIKHINEIFQLKLKNAPHWLLSEFLTLVLVCSLLDDLKRESIEKVAEADLIALQSKFEQLYERVASVLEKLRKNNDIQELASPVTWLELISSKAAGFYDFIHIKPWKGDNVTFHAISGKENIVPSEMAEFIWFQHYKLDPIVAKEGIFPVEWYDINKAAELLNLSPDQLIFECFQNDFGTYLKTGSLKISPHKTCPVTQTTIQEVLEPSYQYHYQGLGRLLKESALFGSAETSLKAFYQGSNICVDPQYDYILIRLQPSLAEAVQGITKVIHLDKGQIIEKNCLVFIKSELEEFKAKRANNSFSESNSYVQLQGHTKEKDTSEPVQTRTNALHELIKEIYASSKKKMTNREMWNHLRQLAESDHHIIQSVTSWSVHNAHIEWISQTGSEPTMLRKSFQNLMTKLRNPK